jgi:biotin transport system substrate-specific component
MEKRLSPKTLRSIFVVSFAALVCVSGRIAIPSGHPDAPATLQNMAVILCGLVPGGIQGGAAVGLYIVAGMCGLPVFPGGASGIGALSSSSGGLVVGYFLGSLAAGLYLGAPKTDEKTATKRRVLRLLSAGAMCQGIAYLLGAGHLVHNIGLTIPAALAESVIPFIPGDALKIVCAAALALKLRPVAARYIGDSE